MRTEKIFLNEQKTAWIEPFILEPELGMGQKKKWPIAVIVPGGAYLSVATREGEGVALQFLAMGYSSFVVHYAPFIKNRETGEADEAAHYPSQELYLMEAIHKIKEHAEEWNLDSNRLFTVGFSAGSHISGMVATRWNDAEFVSKLSFVPKDDELKPTGAILCYPMLDGNNKDPYMTRNDDKNPGIKNLRDTVDIALYGHKNPSDEEIDKLKIANYITPNTPPIFLWHTSDDEVVSPLASTELIMTLQKNFVPCEYHLYRHGNHGLATALKPYELFNDSYPHLASWLQLASEWMEEVGNKNE